MDDEIGGVCIVTQPGGGQSEKTHARDLARIVGELTSVAVMTANLSPNSPLRDEQEVVEFSSSAVGDNIMIAAVQFLVNQVRLCLAIHRRDESIVLFFGTTSYLLPVLFARLRGKRVAVLPRGDVPLSLRLRWEQRAPDNVARLFAGMVRVLERLTYVAAHGIITYSPGVAQALDLDRYKSKLHTTGARFIDTDRFSVEVPYDQRGRTVGFLGRLDVEKRIPTLVEAVAQLPDDIQVRFVGDGAYREELERRLADEIATGQVEVVGWVDHEEVPAELDRMRLLLLPSKTEGLPTTILEAMACGTPAYATPVSGVPDVVRDGETGFLMQSVDPDAIAAGITEILDRPDPVTISDQGRDLVETEYSFEAAVQRYERILRTV